MHVTPQAGEEPRGIILVIDHEILARHVLAQYLRECGYGVVQAGATDESLVALRWIADLVVAVLCRTDAKGEMSASELIRRIRVEHPQIPVLLAGVLPSATDIASELRDEAPEIGRPYEHHVVVDEIKRRLAPRG